MVETNAEVIDFFLRENCSNMTVRELAESIGLSRSAVQRRLEKLGLKTRSATKRDNGQHAAGQKAGQAGQQPVRREYASQAPGDDLGRLSEVRERLHGAIAVADDKDLPRLSAEYREVMREIRALNNVEDAEDDDGFGCYE